MPTAKERLQDEEMESPSKQADDQQESEDLQTNDLDSRGKSSIAKLSPTKRYRGVTKCGHKWRGNIYLPSSLVGKKEWKNVGLFDW